MTMLSGMLSEIFFRAWERFGGAPRQRGNNCLLKVDARNRYAGGPRFWPTTGPAILLVSTASQIRAGICRSSRGLGDTFFRTDDGCRLESSVYHLSFMVFGAVDAQTLARAGGLV